MCQSISADLLPLPSSNRFSLVAFLRLGLPAIPGHEGFVGRWWEARTTWGQVFNVSRNLVRQVLLLVHLC